MRFFEAMELLESGKKVRKVNWNEGCYLYINEETGDILDEEDRMYYFTNIKATDNWEEYKEDTRKEVEPIFKELYRIVQEIIRLPIERDLILQFITQNDFRYNLDELKLILDILNNNYKLDN